PAVFDPEEAMKPSSPKIHEAKDQNIVIRVRNEWGDIEKGFREADHIFEGRYETSIQAHCAMEPHGCLADYNKVSGDITVWSTTQIPFQVLRIINEVLGIKMSKIRVIKTSTGGGFGGKDEILVEPLCALFSVKTGRPVKLILTREEVFVGTRTRHPSVICVKTGVKNDGTLTARHIKAVLNGGAYAGATPGVVGAMSTREIGLYRCENVRFEGFGVYTNTPVAAAFRGYGNPQHNFAVDTHMDEIAEKIGMDPLEFKLKNTIREGDMNHGTGIRLGSCGLQECIERGAEKAEWTKKRRSARTKKGNRWRGIGMACFMHNSNVFPYGSECSSALVKVNDDGTATAHFGAADMGQGSSTLLAKIAAEELGMSLENINIVTGDTASVPYDPGSYGSRTTYMMGNAVKEAARDAKMQIITRASKILNVDSEKLMVENGEVKVRGKNKRISISEVVKKTIYSTKEGGVVMGKSSYSPPSNAPYFGALHVFE
ncbi:MAG: molybdopterin cofactor-binding domain-containing protein, partial [Methanobacteriota archaeon]